MAYNPLDELLAQLSPEDANALLQQQNPLARIMQPQSTSYSGGNALGPNMPMAPSYPDYQRPEGMENYIQRMNGPDAGKVVNLDPVLAQARAQQQAQAPRMMQVIGTGNGHTVTLQPQEAPGQLNLGNNAVEFRGQKYYYSKDEPGVAYLLDPNTRQPKAKLMLGYDMAGSMALNKADLERRKGEAGIAHTMEEIEASKARRTARPEGPAAPSGYRYKGDGTLEAIPGGPADQKSQASTEDEKRSAGLAIRMENAIKRMDAYPEATSPEKLPSAVRALTGFVSDAPANALTSGPRQIVEGSQLDALDAALTLATGAAYTKDQLKNLSKSYFPQIGDDPETVADKRARFEDVIKTARIRAGRVAPKIDQVESQSAPVGQSKTFDKMPSPAQLKGKTIADDNGNRFKSDGVRWVRVS